MPNLVAFPNIQILPARFRHYSALLLSYVDAHGAGLRPAPNVLVNFKIPIPGGRESA
jgi:hypothetical protein